MCNSQGISPHCHTPPFLYYGVFLTTTTFSYIGKNILVMMLSDPFKGASMEQFLWLTQ